MSPPIPKRGAEREEETKKEERKAKESKYKKIALVSIVVGIILYVEGLSMEAPGYDLFLVYLMDALMLSGLIAIMFGAVAVIRLFEARVMI